MKTLKVKTLYCDMDGVLADFKGHFKKLFNKEDTETPDPELWALIENYGKAKFFSELPWMPGGQELWNFITDNFMRVKILSACGKSDKVDGQTSSGKKAWLSKHISNLPTQDIILVDNKRKKRYYSQPGDIIIDDTPIVIEDWLGKGGIGILHTSAEKTINELEQYLYDEVETK